VAIDPQVLACPQETFDFFKNKPLRIDLYQTEST
jgi:hypothetical protein